MQKKIIAAALTLLVLTCVVTACGDGEREYEPVEYTTDANGELYVTNVYGDLIPVTTGVDGSMELLEDLYTKTAEQVSEDISRMEEEAGATTDGNAGNGDSGDAGNNGDTGNGNDSGDSGDGGIQIGSESPQNDEDHEAVIVW